MLYTTEQIIQQHNLEESLSQWQKAVDKFLEVLNKVIK